MEQSNWFVVVIVGAVFAVLGLAGIFWGIHEEKRLFEELAAKPDLREFSLKHVETPQPGALKIGGWIAIAVGIIVIALGIILWQTGWPPLQ
jgi:multisubunit Na+/H+ antiporter MnhB subunit